MLYKFFDYTADVYTFSTQNVRGSLVQKKTAKYTGIKVAFWKGTRRYGDSTLSSQSDDNKYTIDLRPENPVNIGDIVEINNEAYKVDDVIEHHNHKGVLENHEAYISKTTKDG